MLNTKITVIFITVLSYSSFCSYTSSCCFTISLASHNNFYSGLLFPQFAICFTPYSEAESSLPALFPFLAQQPLLHSLFLPPTLTSSPSVLDGTVSIFSVSVLSHFLTENILSLFCTANTLLSRISLTALLSSPLN